MKMFSLFVMILLVMIGCGGDEEEPFEPSKDDLVGPWEIVSIDGETANEAFAPQEEGVEIKVPKAEYLFVADGSLFVNLELEIVGDFGSGLSQTLRQTLAMTGKYTVSGSKLSLVIADVNVILEPKDVWEAIGVTEEAMEAEFREDFFKTEHSTWSLSGNTLTLTDDDGEKIVLRKS